jgi:sec-independent protein translocase protein TatA
MLEGIGGPELIVILLLAVLLFGGKKIPEIGRGLGQSIRNFRSSIKGVTDEAKSIREEVTKDI